MARGVNKVILLGHVGKDPTTAALPSGLVVTEFSLATTESWTDKQTGEKKGATEWHNIKLFGKVAEIAADFVRKGTLVYIEGKIKTRQWEKDGAKHYKTEIHADQLQLLSSREGGQDSGARGGHSDAGNNRHQATMGTAFSQHDSPLPIDFDDDIPF